MRKQTHLLRPAELDQLRQLRDRLGVSKLARALDLPFYACRSMLNVERISDRTLQRVRDHLPEVAERHLALPLPESPRPHVPLQAPDADVQALLATLSPYVSMMRLAHALGLSFATLKAATAGYRRMHTSTLDALRGQLDELLQPPYEALRATLRSPTPDAVLRGLRVGVLLPLPGMSVAQTEAILLAAAPPS
jgi:hypothetical protein